MSNLTDSFKYSVAGGSFRGYLYADDSCDKTCSYSKEKIQNTYMLYLQTASPLHYPVAIETVQSVSINSTDSTLFRSPDIDRYESMVLFTDRKQCDLCDVATDRLHKISTKSLYSIEYKSTEMNDFYQCHNCMYDVCKQVHEYINTVGTSVIAARSI